MLTEFEYEGFALGQSVRDTLDGYEGVITGLVIHRFDVPQANVEERIPDGKCKWLPLGRLEPHSPPHMGLTGGD